MHFLFTHKETHNRLTVVFAILFVPLQRQAIQLPCQDVEQPFYDLDILRLANNDVLMTLFEDHFAVTINAVRVLPADYRVAEVVLTNPVQQKLVPKTATLTLPAVVEFLFRDVSLRLVVNGCFQINHRKVVLREEVLNFGSGVLGFCFGVDRLGALVEPLQFLQFREDRVDVLSLFHNQFCFTISFPRAKVRRKCEFSERITKIFQQSITKLPFNSNSYSRSASGLA